MVLCDFPFFFFVTVFICRPFKTPSKCKVLPFFLYWKMSVSNATLYPWWPRKAIPYTWFFFKSYFAIWSLCGCYSVFSPLLLGVFSPLFLNGSELPQHRLAAFIFCRIPEVGFPTWVWGTPLMEIMGLFRFPLDAKFPSGCCVYFLLLLNYFSYSVCQLVFFLFFSQASLSFPSCCCFVSIPSLKQHTFAPEGRDEI